jgi:hypothetical protein
MASFLFRIIFPLAILGGIYSYSNANQSNTQANTDTNTDYVSFLFVPKLDNPNPKTVTVIAPYNCSREESQRAYKLIDDLKQKGIPVLHQNHSLLVSPPVPSEYVSIFDGPLPIVYIGSLVKANPTLEEVIAAYTSLEKIPPE